MAKVHVDLTQMEEGGFTVITPGQYVAKIKSVTEKLSSQAKQRMLSITLQIKTGELIGTNVMLEGKGAFKFAELYNAISPEKQVKQGDAFEFDIDKLVNKVVGIVVEDDEYQGKVKSRIAQFIKTTAVKKAETVVAEEPKTEAPQPPIEDIPVTKPEVEFDAEIDF